MHSAQAAVRRGLRDFVPAAFRFEPDEARFFDPLARAPSARRVPRLRRSRSIRSTTSADCFSPSTSSDGFACFRLASTMAMTLRR